jgi:putative ABC transport system permease protein
VIEPAALVPVAGAVAVLTGVAVVVLRVTGVAGAAAPATAVLRAIVQLAVLSVVLTGVIRDLRLVGLALVVMLVAAVWTSARRIGRDRRVVLAAAAGMTLGSGTALAVVFAFGAVAREPRYLLAVGGIVVGGSMTVATVVGRAFVDRVRDRWAEVEGWLALGATPRAATRELRRDAVHTALTPLVDQTRTTGLVVLPGAFVGAIFGGLPPVDAAMFQLVVLAALLGSGAVVTVVATSVLAGRPTQPPAHG